MSVGDKIPPKIKVPPEGYSLLPEVESLVQSAVRDSLRSVQTPAVVLAVSGGIDSMVLLDAAVESLKGGKFRSNDRKSVGHPSAEASTVSEHLLPTLIVATFDHGTGPAATEAAALVLTRAQELGLLCVQGQAKHPGKTEAEWRQARWTFLRGVAREHNATIATAHTQSDQIETVFMRALRDAGPRGLAALYAPSDILRPLLYLPREIIAGYAKIRGITYVTDPSNFNTRYLRNRVRHQILPRIRAVRPSFERELLDIATRAAHWRTQMDQIAANFTVMIDGNNSAYIPRAQFAGYSEDALRALWPALAARANIVMDWRGTHRLATFTIEGDPGQSIQLSGGIHVHLRRDTFILTRVRSRV
jgi:tRNA(Ile)-lysidine synthase